MGIDISPECAWCSMCIGSPQSQTCVQRYLLMCTTQNAITQSPRTGYMCIDFPPAAQRDPDSHVPGDTAICINHTHSNLHTWAPIQISVDRSIGVTCTRRHHRDCWTCLELGKYIVLGVLGTEKNTHPHCNDTCG